MSDSKVIDGVKQPRTDGKRSRAREPFIAPETVLHLPVPSGTIQYICIHYGTTVKTLKRLNPEAEPSFLILPTALIIPWPTSDDVPCKSCKGHAWCQSVAKAMYNNKAIKRSSSSSQEELKNTALNLVRQTLKNSTSALTYSRVKIALEERYGHLLVSSIKTEIQQILQEGAEDLDRRQSLPLESPVKEEKHNEDFAAMFGASVLFSPNANNNNNSSSKHLHDTNSDSESSGASSHHESEDIDTKDLIPVASPPKDSNLLRLELLNWEREMQKLDASDENESVLRQMLQNKIDGIRDALSISGELLSNASSKYLSKFDKQFSLLRLQAQIVVTENETACTCCGRPLIAGTKVPDQCVYQDDLATILKPEHKPVGNARLPTTAQHQASGLLSTREDEDMYEL